LPDSKSNDSPNKVACKLLSRLFQSSELAPEKQAALQDAIGRFGHERETEDNIEIVTYKFINEAKKLVNIIGYPNFHSFRGMRNTPHNWTQN